MQRFSPSIHLANGFAWPSLKMFNNCPFWQMAAIRDQRRLINALESIRHGAKQIIRDKCYQGYPSFYG